MTDNIDWSKSICGVHKSDPTTMIKNMPELKGVIEAFPEDPNDFVWDVKVHMLMPRQYPCIPNWHSDLVPRNEQLLEQWDKLDPSAPMYLWLSGEPFTEFFDGREVIANTWIRFNQLDTHRGMESKIHTWRCFIRAVHNSLITLNPPDRRVRRHTQIYLDATNFRW